MDDYFIDGYYNGADTKDEDPILKEESKNRIVNQYIATTMALTELMDPFNLSGHRSFLKIKEKKKCKLPECKNKTVHRGGYCCAEHCKLHRELLKIKRENT